MTDRELQKLSRKDLLQLLLEQGKQLQQLQQQLDAAQAALRDRSLQVEKAGSLAEAALMVNGVFEAAQAACQQYTENIRVLSQQQEERCARMEEESREKAQTMLEMAQKQKEELETQTRLHCEQMVEQARAESQAYWLDVSGKLEQFSAAHSELQQLLATAAEKKQG